jgi:hypothetical protein
VVNRASTGTHTFSAQLISSRDFEFQGETVNFRSLVPYGITALATTSNVIVGASTELAQPFAFSAIAMGEEGTPSKYEGREDAHFFIVLNNWLAPWASTARSRFPPGW